MRDWKQTRRIVLVQNVPLGIEGTYLALLVHPSAFFAVLSDVDARKGPVQSVQSSDDAHGYAIRCVYCALDFQPFRLSSHVFPLPFSSTVPDSPCPWFLCSCSVPNGAYRECWARISQRDTQAQGNNANFRHDSSTNNTTFPILDIHQEVNPRVVLENALNRRRSSYHNLETVVDPEINSSLRINISSCSSVFWDCPKLSSLNWFPRIAPNYYRKLWCTPSSIPRLVPVAISCGMSCSVSRINTFLLFLTGNRCDKLTDM